LRDQWYDASRLPRRVFFLDHDKIHVGHQRADTQVFDEKGVVHAATIVSAGPLTVTQVKEKEKDGYEAVAGRLRREEGIPCQQGAEREAVPLRPRVCPRSAEPETRTRADDRCFGFAPGDVVEVLGDFKGERISGRREAAMDSTGPSQPRPEEQRARAGSIGGGGRAGGRGRERNAHGRPHGGDRVTVKNLTVLQIDAATNTLVISGAIPGRPGTLVESAADRIPMKTNIYNIQGKVAGSVELPESVFGVAWNDALMHQVITAMQANARTPVAHVKDSWRGARRR